jgi:pimeloyl-ACP methyl ester carboxylesterase
MPTVTAKDGTKLYYEEAGSGTPVVFVHEYAGDYRTWEPQLRYFSRQYRCVTYSARGYPPSDIPQEQSSYSQDIARDDVIAVMDGLGIRKAHVVGHSMGAYTALHVGLNYPDRSISVAAIGGGWGSTPDSKLREQMKGLASDTGKMFAEQGIAKAAAQYGDAPMRQSFKHKDPRGWAEFARMLGEHSAHGHAMTMFGLQLSRPTFYEMADRLKTFKPPLLVIVGDEDDLCIDASVFLKRTAPTAAMAMIPRSGHTVTSEEPAAVNAALTELFCAAEAGRWLVHKGA